MNKGIVIAGNILIDIVKIIDSYPEKGMLSSITNISKAVGGCVPNTIINLAKIDNKVPLTAIGRIGDDSEGEFLSSEFKKYGIKTKNVKVIKNQPTSFSDVMTVNATGERTFFHARGANAEFNFDDIDINNLDCDIFHIGYILLLDELDKPDKEYGTKMARLLKQVQDKGIRTSIDVVSEEGDRFKKIVTPALKYCNYVIINEVEAGKIACINPREKGIISLDNIKKILQNLFNYGVKEKVIIHCPEAGFCMDKSGLFTIVGSLKLPKDYIKGTVGAGDAFCAGVLYSLYNNYDDEKLLKFASNAAACNLSQADSISGMKNKDDVINMDNVYKRRII